MTKEEEYITKICCGKIAETEIPETQNWLNRTSAEEIVETMERMFRSTLEHCKEQREFTDRNIKMMIDPILIVGNKISKARDKIYKYHDYINSLHWYEFKTKKRMKQKVQKLSLLIKQLDNETTVGATTKSEQ